MADQGQPTWRTTDAEGDGLCVEWGGIYNEMGTVLLKTEVPAGAALALDGLRALIAELTRRERVLAGEAGEARAGGYGGESPHELATIVAAVLPPTEKTEIAEDKCPFCQQSVDDSLRARITGEIPDLHRWRGLGWYAGRDAAGRPVLLHAETPAGLARIGAAAGVARWSGPHASLAHAGKALDAEGGK